MITHLRESPSPPSAQALRFAGPALRKALDRARLLSSHGLYVEARMALQEAQRMLFAEVGWPEKIEGLDPAGIVLATAP